MRVLVCAVTALALATCAAGAVGGDPGVTPTAIVLGGTVALTGAESAYYAPIAKGAQAYFAYVNANGGVLGRKIDYRVDDDAYDPAQTVQQTTKLVEQDQVFAIFNSTGTDEALSVRPYLNQLKVPQLFVWSGARKVFQGRKGYPWTMPFLPSFFGEGKLYGQYLAASSPSARIAVLYEDDDYGTDLRAGLRKGLQGKGRIVGTASYELTDADVSAQIASLKATRANTLVLFALPKEVTQAVAAARKLRWHPRYVVSGASIDPSATHPPDGTVSSAFVRLVTDPRLAKDKGAKLYRSVMKKYCVGCDANALAYVYGMAAAFTMVDALEHAGKNPTRGSLLRASTHLSEPTNPFLQPGVTIKTSPTDYAPFEQLRLVRYRTGHWDAFGSVATVGR